MARAESSAIPMPSSHIQTANPIRLMVVAAIRVSSSISRSKSPSPGGRGGRCIAPGSPGSKARPTCWIPFVTRLSQRSWIAARGRGRPAMVEKRKSSTSAAPVVIRR